MSTPTSHDTLKQNDGLATAIEGYTISTIYEETVVAGERKWRGLRGNPYANGTAS